MKKIKFLKNNFLRVIEKLPGINLQQVLKVHGKFFLIVPKNGTRTIRNAFLKEYSLSLNDEWHYITFHTKKSLINLLNSEELVLVTRDPLLRLQSCWKQKIGQSRDQTFLSYFFLYYPFLKRDMSFNGFLKAISKIPPVLSEKHFRPIKITVPIDNKNIVKVPIKQLNNFLDISSKEVANKTKKIEISQQQREIFNELLLNRFEGE